MTVESDRRCGIKRTLLAFRGKARKGVLAFPFRAPFRDADVTRRVHPDLVLTFNLCQRPVSLPAAPLACP